MCLRIAVTTGTVSLVILFLFSRASSVRHALMELGRWKYSHWRYDSVRRRYNAHASTKFSYYAPAPG